MRSGKIIWTIIIILIVIGGIYTLGSSMKEQGNIVLGLVAPLSGDGASFGETEKNATNMAVEEINTAGGIDGRQVSVVSEDGKGTGKDATTAIQKLINIDKVKIVLGGAFSSETLAMAPIAEQNKVILFSSFSSNPAISNAGEYVFRNSPSDSDVAKLDANTIANLYKTVAIITENNDYAQGVRGIMKGIFADKGVTVVADEVYNSGISDFRSPLTKIKSANPEVVYVNSGSSGKAAGAMVKQLRDLGYKGAIHGNFNLYTPDALSVGGSALNGVVVSGSTDLSVKGEQVKAKYSEKFSIAPASDYEMGAAYDRVYIIKQAIEKVGYDTTKIKDYLYQMPDFAGTIGTYHFDQNGDVAGVGFTNLVIKDGKTTPYNQ